MTDYRTTEPRQIAGQGKERKKKRKKKFFFSLFPLFPFFSFLLFPPLFSLSPFPSSRRFKTRKILVFVPSQKSTSACGTKTPSTKQTQKLTGNCAAANMPLLYQSNRPEFLRNEIVASSITLFSIVPKDGSPNKSR